MEMKTRKAKRISYTARFLVFSALIFITGICVYWGYLLHIEGVQIRSELNAVNTNLQSVLDQPANQKSQNQSAGQANADGDIQTLSEALMVMQNQYDSYVSNLTLLLIIFTAGLALFSLAIPLFNYFFLQKDQISNLNSRFEEIVLEIGEHKNSWEITMQNVQNEYQNKLDRMSKTMDQNLDVVSAIADVKNKVKIQAVSNEKKDVAYAHYINALLISRYNLKESIALFQKAIELDPDHARCRASYGDILHKSGCYEESLREMKKAAELDPEQPEYHYRIGENLHKMGHPQEALVQMRKVLKIDPKNAEYHNRAGKILGELERYEEALAEIEKAIQLIPENAEYQNNLSKMFYLLKRYEEALEAARKAVKLDYRNGWYHHSLGNILYMLKCTEEALSEKQKAVELDSDNALFHDSLGDLLHEMKRYQEALAERKKAVELAPNEERYKKHLEYTNLAMKYLNS